MIENEKKISERTMRRIENDLKSLSISAPIKEYLPTHEYACDLVNELYRKDGISNVLGILFGENASDFDGETAYDNLWEFVEFLCDQEKSHPTIINDEDDYDYLCDILEYLAKKALRKGNRADSEDLFEDYVEAVRFYPFLWSFSAICGYLKDNWDVLKNYPRTYEFLGEFVDMKTDWEVVPKKRVELLSILKRTSDEWIKNAKNYERRWDAMESSMEGECD